MTAPALDATGRSRRRARVLFAAPPFFGLLYPMVPLAHAFRAQGHEVLVATASGGLRAATAAGLDAIDCAHGLDADAEYVEVERARGNPDALPPAKPFSFFSDEMADAMVAAAQEWRPDLVVHPPIGVVGQLVAARLGVPSVLHGVGFGHHRGHVDRINATIADAYARHGLDGPDPLAAWLDVAPPSMSSLDEPEQRPMRFVPFNGAEVLPPWLLDAQDRPRVGVTLGTVVPQLEGASPVDWVAEVARQIDAELVLALGGEAEGLGRLPDNVRAVAGWVPLRPLLASSDAVVHHGGAGTTLTALDAAVPQAVLGHGADRPANAAAVADRGCGVRPEAGEVGAELVSRLLSDDGLTRAAGDVRAEMEGMPEPTEVAADLTELAT